MWEILQDTDWRSDFSDTAPTRAGHKDKIDK